MTHPSQTTTIAQLIDAAAQHYGDRIFLQQNQQSFTFEQLAEQCRQVAASLIAAGIKAGDRIAIWAPNTCEWILSALGAQYAGVIVVTMNTRYKGAEAGYTLRKSRARLLFCAGEFLGNYYPDLLRQEQLPDLERIVVHADSNSAHCGWKAFLELGNTISSADIDRQRDSIQGDDTSDILFTSGTTGEPKGVMTGHQQNIRTFANWSKLVGLQEGDRYLVVSPFFHSFGYKAGILASLMRGATLLPHDVFDPVKILQRIENEKITVMPGPPTLFQSLLASPELSSFDISSLKRATTGAASIPVEMIRAMKTTLGFETVLTAYGLTESCGVSTMCRAGDDAETVATTSGRAIDGVEIRCVDQHNQPVANGEAGEIVVRGYNVMQGYFENENATKEAIDSDGWLHTGDVGVLDHQGNLKITDRLKDMFITGGFNCYPAEIENILANHQGITMSAVVGIPDERMGEVAAAFIVSHTHSSDLNEAALIAWCRDHMANYKVPRKVIFVDELPINASGKVQKNQLRDTLMSVES
ncbi:MAG: fatty acid--CoA ligase [Cellvibrionaceae bacterium]|nr:fatty acid--CoA ligase [Cellvibrionaceae bacterium]|tara:strand:+ start:1418 stop:3001 length:1584 start_codon:yes stop_codon:yes gene_type:complete